MTTPVLITGWEHGLAALSVNGGGLAETLYGSGMSVQATTKRTGGYALKCTPSSAECYYRLAALATPTVVVGRIYVCFHEWNDGDNDLVWHDTTSANTLALKIRSATHTVYSRVWGVADGNACATVLSLDTWYRLDYKFSVAANPWTIDFQVDGVAATQSTFARAATTFTNPGLDSVTATRLRHTLTTG